MPGVFLDDAIGFNGCGVGQKPCRVSSLSSSYVAFGPILKILD